MPKLDDDLETENLLEETTRVNRRKVLFILVPAIIIIGLSVGFYFAFNHSFGKTDKLNYSIVKNTTGDEDGQSSQSVTVFYELPEANIKIKKRNGGEGSVKMKISLELGQVEDIQIIEGLLPKINDAVISHTIELTAEEISGSSGLYWLKEELLYRINLLTAPLQVSNLNFKSLDVATSNENKG